MERNEQREIKSQIVVTHGCCSFLHLCLLQLSVFQTLILGSPTSSFLLPKREPSWRKHISTLISSIISLWASSSAGPLMLLSNPFTYVSHQPPIPFPMVALTSLLWPLLQAPASTSPTLFLVEGLPPTSWRKQMASVRHVSSQFPLPPPNSVCSLLSQLLPPRGALEVGAHQGS